MLRKETIEESIEQGNVESVQSYLMKGTPLPAILKGGFTPLTWASQIQNGTMISLCVQAGADITQPDQNGVLPKYTESMEIHEIVTGLSKKFIDLNFSRSASHNFVSLTPNFIKDACDRVNRIKRFGHILGVEATITIKQKAMPDFEAVSVPVDTEGLIDSAKSNIMMQELILRYLFHPSVCHSNVFLEIFQGINNTREENVKRISKGSAVIAITGYSSHTTAIAVYNDYLIYANRPTISLYKLNPEQKAKITVKWLQEIGDIKHKDKLYPLDKLSQIIDIAKPTQVINRSPQTHSTCSLLNPKALIEPIFYLYHLRNGMNEQDSLSAALISYKHFTSISRDVEIERSIYSVKHGGPQEKKLYRDLFDHYLGQHNGSKKGKRSDNKHLADEQRREHILRSLAAINKDEIVASPAESKEESELISGSSLTKGL